MPLLNIFQKSFPQLPFVPLWEAFLEDVQQRHPQQSVGLVFPRRGFVQGMVIHNAGLRYIEPGTGAVVFKAANEWIVVQSFTSLAKVIRKARDHKTEGEAFYEQ